MIFKLNSSFLGFYAVDAGLKTSSDADFAGSKIFAMGDMNNDKYNDLVTVTDDMRTLMPYFYNSETYKF